MFKKILKYSVITIVSVIIVLAFTNPTLKQFKEYIGDRHSWKYYEITMKRTQNWLIYSTYEISYSTNDKYYEEEVSSKTQELNNLRGSYTGFFLNFYKK